jgi:hypothetical protein
MVQNGLKRGEIDGKMMRNGCKLIEIGQKKQLDSTFFQARIIHALLTKENLVFPQFLSNPLIFPSFLCKTRNCHPKTPPKQSISAYFTPKTPLLPLFLILFFFFFFFFFILNFNIQTLSFPGTPPPKPPIFRSFSIEKHAFSLKNLIKTTNFGLFHP